MALVNAKWPTLLIITLNHIFCACATYLQNSQELYNSNYLMSKKPGAISDIEAIRRSALDKNFIRLGRAHPLWPQDDPDFEPDYTRFIRNPNKLNGFIRFGRTFDLSPRSEGKQRNFIRFGKRFGYKPVTNADDELKPVKVTRKKRETPFFNDFDRMQRAAVDRNMIRFGRADAMFDDAAVDRARPGSFCRYCLPARYSSPFKPYFMPSGFKRDVDGAPESSDTDVTLN